MTLSLTANFKQAFGKSQITPVIYVAITATTSVELISTAENSLGTNTAMPIVESVSPLSPQIDHYERVVTNSEMTVVIADVASFREIMATTAMRGRVIELKLGEASLTSLSDYAAYWKGYIKDVTAGEGFITILCEDPLAQTFHRDYSLGWVNEHPITLAKKILQGSGVQVADMDLATFTHTSYTDVSHFNTSGNISFDEVATESRTGHERHRQMAPGHLHYKWDTVDARTLLNAINKLMISSITTGEDGIVRFKLFDVNGASVRDLGDDDIETLTHESGYDNVINVLNIETSVVPNQKAHVWKRFTSSSITLFGQSFARRENFDVLCQRTPLKDQILTTAAQAVTLSGWGSAGFAGVNNLYPGPQNAAEQLSALRQAYLLVDEEIISENTPVVNNTPFGILFPGILDEDGVFVVGTYDQQPGYPTYPSVVRGVFSTTASTHLRAVGLGDNESIPPWCYDLTMIERWSTVTLFRYSRGLPIIKITTDFRNYDLQLGDIITVTNSQFFWIGNNGVGTNIRWEIIGKEVDPLSDDVKVTFTLAYIRDFNEGVPVISDSLKKPASANSVSVSSVGESGDYGPSHIMDGLEVTNGGSLTVLVSNGTFMARGVQIRSRNDLTAVAVSASKDNYVYVQANSGFIYIEAVAIGAQEPAVDNVLPLAMVRTNGATIDFIHDLRNFRGVNPRYLHSESSPAGDLIYNSNFQIYSRHGAYEPDNWKMLTGTWNTDARRYHDFFKSPQTNVVQAGQYALEFPDGAASSIEIRSSMFTLEVDQVYRVTVDVRTATATQSIEIAVDFFSRTKVKTTDTIIHTTNIGVANTYVPIMGVFQVPAGSFYGRVRLKRNPGETSQVLWKTASVKKASGIGAAVTFSAYVTAATTAIANGAISLVIPFDAVQQFVTPPTISNNFGGFFNTATSRFTAPRRGTYYFGGAVNLEKDMGTPLTGAIVSLRRNGTTLLHNIRSTDVVNTEETSKVFCWPSVHLEKGDYVEIFFSKVDGTNVILLGGTAESHFQGGLLE